MSCSITTFLSISFKVSLKTNSSQKDSFICTQKCIWICKYKSYGRNIRHVNFSSVKEFSTSRYVKKLRKGNVLYINLWKEKKEV